MQLATVHKDRRCMLHCGYRGQVFETNNPQLFGVLSSRMLKTNVKENCGLLRRKVVGSMASILLKRRIPLLELFESRFLHF